MTCRWSLWFDWHEKTDRAFLLFGFFLFFFFQSKQNRTTKLICHPDSTLHRSPVQVSNHAFINQSQMTINNINWDPRRWSYGLSDTYIFWFQFLVAANSFFDFLKILHELILVLEPELLGNCVQVTDRVYFSVHVDDVGVFECTYVKIQIELDGFSE